MGVAAERQRDALGDAREDVGVVAEQQHGRVVGHGGERAADVGRPLGGVGQAGDPQLLGHAREADRLVLEHADAGVAQRLGDPRPVVGPVVVAEHGDACPAARAWRPSRSATGSGVHGARRTSTSGSM